MNDFIEYLSKWIHGDRCSSFDGFVTPKQNGVICDRQHKWDLRFLDLSKHISSWSKDPSTKVGAVITKDNKILSVGYNGLPQNVDDDINILNNREEKYKYVIHAEMNAILTCSTSIKDATIYTYPFLPCTNCASMIVQSGIKRVVSLECSNPRWKTRLHQSKHFLNSSNIDVVEYSVYT